MTPQGVRPHGLYEVSDLKIALASKHLATESNDKQPTASHQPIGKVCGMQ
jgi:hypothetical protein